MLSSLMRYFMAVAKEGSVRQAAATLHISASAINRHILDFEHQLGVPLFERMPRGMRLTTAGQALYEASKRMAHEWENALSEVDLIRGAKRGHVTIGTLQLLAEHFFPPILTRLLSQHPGITYSFVVGASAEIARLVVQGDLDIGMVWDPRDSESVRRLRSARVPFGVALPIGHPLTRKDEIRLEDCLSYPLIFPAVGELREVLDRLNLGRKVKAIPAVETQSIGMMRALVRSGNAVALTSHVTVMRAGAEPEVEFRPLKNTMRLSTVMSLFVRNERRLPPAVGVVAQVLTEAFPEFG